jgi:uncharacterized membrane protein/thiol-disulfide isomerase/thioredoxin
MAWPRPGLLALIVACAWLLSAARAGWADTGQVRAVLFYSPTCPHCHLVIQETLLPLLEDYGGQLEIVGIDVTQAAGQALYQAAIERFAIPDDRLGVPTLVVGETVLVGSVEIPEQFPGLIEQLLADGGVDWPDIPGLSDAVATAPPTPSATPSEVTPTAALVAASPSPIATLAPTTTSTLSQRTPAAVVALGLDEVQAGGPPDSVLKRVALDPAGNGLAILVLGGMVLVVGRVAASWIRREAPRQPEQAWPGWLLPGLAALGLIVAGYLTFVEVTNTEAVCGPVGDCNTVQQSSYARLFGVLPIGLAGLAGYAAILALWLLARHTQGRTADLARVGLGALALGGTLFSIYLTFLEPFVIGATCAWCLTLAMTGLLWITAEQTEQAVTRLTSAPRRRRLRLPDGDKS